MVGLRGRRGFPMRSPTPRTPAWARSDSRIPATAGSRARARCSAPSTVEPTGTAFGCRPEVFDGSSDLVETEPMPKYEIVDADCHILEPPDIWKNWLPKRFQDKAPKLVKDADGGDAWQFDPSGDPDPIGLVSTPGMPWDEFRWTGVTYDDARPGCYNGAERLKDMDIDGVDAELLFAPQRTIGHFLGDPDEDFVLAGVEAYNTFLLEEF